MHGLFPDGEPKVINLVGYRSWKNHKDPTRYNFSYQYGYGDTWLIVNLAFQKTESDITKIFGFNVYPSLQSLEELHQFSVSDVSALRLIFLIACAVIPLFVVFTLVVCIRTKLKKKKWPWILFILIGFIRFSLNRTTGQLGIALYSAQLLGSGALTASVYAPWIFSFSIPFGAILFWVKRDSIRSKKPDCTPNPDASLQDAIEERIHS